MLVASDMYDDDPRIRRAEQQIEAILAPFDIQTQARIFRETLRLLGYDATQFDL